MNAAVTSPETRNGLDISNVLHDCLNCAIILVDERRTVTGFNLQAETLTHLKADRAIGQSVTALPAPIGRLIEETFETGQSVINQQILLHGKKKGELPVQIHTTAVKQAGRVASVVAVLNDVSSVKNWEANMRRIDRLHSVGALSASMAHEIKNAFVAVRTFVDLLLEQNKHSDLANVVRIEMGRIEAILAQMRKFSGPPKTELTPVHLHQVMEKSLLLIQHLVEEKKLRVTRSLAAPHDLLQGNPDQLEQAFINLFFNALDAMKPNGKLTVATDILPANAKISGLPAQAAGPFLRVTVQDTGSGIPKENIAQLFEPFFTTKAEGTGLGLPITQRIVQEHHGVITVQSEVNKGTTFSLIFPTHGHKA